MEEEEEHSGVKKQEKKQEKKESKFLDLETLDSLLSGLQYYQTSYQKKYEETSEPVDEELVHLEIKNTLTTFV